MTLPVTVTSEDPRLTELKVALAEQEVRKTKAEAEVAEMNLNLIKAGNEHNRTLVIDGAILDTEADCNTLMRWARMDPGCDVRVLINTPGGSIFDGNVLVSVIKDMQRKGHHFTIKGAGAVFSYGAVLLAIGDRRILDKDAVVMIHSLQAMGQGLTGSMEQVSDQTEMLKQVNERLLERIAERSNLSAKKLRSMTERRDLFLSASDALKYGICDEVE